MKIINAILLLILSLNALAQYPNNPNPANTSTNTIYQGPISSSQGIGYKIYSDTTAANFLSYLKTVPGITVATSGGVLWQRNYNATRWIQVSAPCNGLQPNTGIVTWSGTGLIFNATTAIFCINGSSYTALGAATTLATADPSFGRFDVIFADTTGAIGHITGTPSATPAVPQVDGTKQVYLTNVFVGAGATTPGGITQKIIYDENTEWTTSSFGTITAVFTDTHNPYHLVKDIQATSIALSSGLQFTNSTTVNQNDYSILNLHAASISGTGGTADISLTSGGVPVTSKVPITISSSTSYQNISIPITSFSDPAAPVGGYLYDGVRIVFSSANSTGVFIDYINLQGGIPTGGGNYVTNVFRKTATDSLFQTRNGINYFVSLIDTSITASPWSRTGHYIYPSNILDSVGIGTATPLAMLDVAGGINLTGNVRATSGKKVFALTANGSGSLNFNAANISLQSTGGAGTNAIVPSESNIGMYINGSQKLSVTSAGLQITDGTQGADKVFTSDVSGNGTWQTPAVGAFIPLSGTVSGSPVTGDIEVLDDAFNIISIKQNQIGDQKAYLTFNGDSPDLELGTSDLSGNVSYVSISGGEINLISTGVITSVATALAADGGRGLVGGDDYTANITDFDYTQKKYVDETVAAAEANLPATQIFVGTGTGFSGSANLTYGSSKLNVTGVTQISDTVIAPKIKVTGGTPGIGKVLTSDGVGNGTWQTAAAGTVTSVSGTTNRITSTGGTTPIIDMSSTFEGLLGKVANPLSQFASTTSSQLAGVISDETGTGALVFAGSPALTGTPTAPTATVGTNTTQIATTAFVQAASLGANNGDTIVGGLVGLGGTLTRSTNILGNYNNFIIDTVGNLFLRSVFSFVPSIVASLSMNVGQVNITGSGGITLTSSSTVATGGLTATGNLISNGTFAVNGGLSTLQSATATSIVSSGNIETDAYNTLPPGYFTPTTGSTISTTVGDNIIEPAGALVALTINLPSSPVNGQKVHYTFTQAITTVTFANGTTVNPVSTTAAGGEIGWQFYSGTGKWYKY